MSGCRSQRSSPCRDRPGQQAKSPDALVLRGSPLRALPDSARGRPRYGPPPADPLSSEFLVAARLAQMDGWPSRCQPPGSPQGCLAFCPAGGGRPNPSPIPGPGTRRRKAYLRHGSTAAPANAYKGTSCSGRCTYSHGRLRLSPRGRELLRSLGTLPNRVLLARPASARGQA
jgi:hypothetical protein